MAVKKVKETENKEVNVQDNTQEVDVTLEEQKGVEADNIDTESDVETEVETEVQDVEVEIPSEPTQDVEVETEKAKVDTSNKPNGNVKIRMRVDHKCVIAMERYDLKAGKTYVVPLNVKRVLNKAGLLAPL